MKNNTLDKAREILNTWNKKDLIEDAILNMNESEILEFVKDNEEFEE